MKKREGWCDKCQQRCEIRECPNCAGRICDGCRDDSDKCAWCNAYTGPDQSCRLGGGCGK